MSHQIAADELSVQVLMQAFGSLADETSSEFVAHLQAGCQCCQAEVFAFEAVVADLAFAVEAIAPPISARAKLLASLSSTAVLPIIVNNSLTSSLATLVAEQTIESTTSTTSTSSISPLPSLLTLRANEGEWRDITAGVSAKLLFINEVAGTVSALVRLDAGAGIELHQHQGAEECFVLAGDFHVGDSQINEVVLTAGDYHCAVAGSIHGISYSENGALLLVIVPTEYGIFQAIHR